MLQLHIPAVFMPTIDSRVALDAILLEVMFINERNNTHACMRVNKTVQDLSIFVDPLIIGTNF